MQVGVLQNHVINCIPMSEIIASANTKILKNSASKKKIKSLKKVVKEKKVSSIGVASYFRASLKGKKQVLLKKDAMAIMKNAFEKTFPDISKYATMKLIKGNAKGEQTLTFTINDDIMKADVVLC